MDGVFQTINRNQRFCGTLSLQVIAVRIKLDEENYVEGIIRH